MCLCVCLHWKRGVCVTCENNKIETIFLKHKDTSNLYAQRAFLIDYYDNNKRKNKNKKVVIKILKCSIVSILNGMLISRH